MQASYLFSVLAVGALTVTGGCKIVKTPDPSEVSAADETQSDEARMAAYAREIWAPKVLPEVAGHLVALSTLRAALASDAEAAGAAHGLRPDGEANPWNFAVSGEGIIKEAKLKSRAAKLQVDTDGDGTADVTLQLGPVIRGTALRDAMPFLTFSAFRDQIEFAKLANGLNAMAHEGLPKLEGDVIGETVRFEGVFTYKNLTAKPEIVPTALDVSGS